MDGEARPGGMRPGPRRLKDISHLYLSRRAGAPPLAPVRVRRCLRLGLVSGANGGAKVEVCGNLAVQFARLQQRTLVLDLDLSLPNVGFRLGLEPGAYMAHLEGGGGRIERGSFAVRIVEGLAGCADLDAALTSDMRKEIRDSDCILVSLPALAAGAETEVARLATVHEAPPSSTAARAATHSPMFEAWMTTVTRGAGREPLPAAASAASGPFDALVVVRDRAPGPGEDMALRRLRERLAPVPVQILEWGESGMVPTAWARVPAHPVHSAVRAPLSALYPEHPAARLYEGLAQSLLAGLGSKGGARARDSNLP